jgi:hypothetical protein
LPWNYSIVAVSAGNCEEAQSLAIGQIQTTSGSVTVTRPGGISVAVKPGDLVYQGEVIETAADGAVGITFRDGTTFKLSNSARMALDEFACDPKGAARSALFGLAQGTFAFIAGELAKTGDLRIETPVASIRGRGQGGGIGILTLAALTFSVVQEGLAANPDDAEPDYDPITIKELLHGTFTLAIKDATGVPTGQVVTVDNPEETVRIRVRGSTASVDHVTNTMSRMTDMQGDYEHAVETLRQGYSFLQQRNPTDYASTAGGSAGGISSSGFVAISTPLATTQTASVATPVSNTTQTNSTATQPQINIVVPLTLPTLPTPPTPPRLSPRFATTSQASPVRQRS